MAKSNNSMIPQILVLLIPRSYREQALGDLEERLGCSLQPRPRGVAGNVRLYLTVIRIAWAVRVTDRRVRSRDRREYRRERAQAPLSGYERWEEHMRAVMRDLRYTFRSWSRKPGFYTVIFIVFALGIGTSTLVFSLVNGVLLQPLPYAEPDRLTIPWQTHPHWRDGDNATLRARWDRFTVSYPVYEDWLEQSPVFEDVGIHLETVFIAEGSEQAERIRGTRATFGVFRALGVEPLLGRTFLPEEDRIGGPRLVVLSYGLWQERYGSDPDILGRTMILNEQPFTITGVMPRGFYFPAAGRLWATFSDAYREMHRNSNTFTPIARLRPGISLDVAQREMEALAEHLKEVHPIPGRDYGINLTFLHDEVVGDVRSALVLLLNAVGIVLLIACANIASLLLLRASERRRELAVRLSLGAGRRRLMGQLLTEGIALSVLGGGLGLVLAAVSLGPFLHLLPPDTPRLDEISLDPGVLIFSIVLSVITGIVVSLLPGLASSGMKLTTVLKDTALGAMGSRRRNRAHTFLLVSEIALTFVLLVGAGLLTTSFTRLMTVDKGFIAEGVLTVSLDMRGARYASDETRSQAYAGISEALASVPGVTALSAASFGPFRGMSSDRSTMETRSGLVETPIDNQSVSPSYFATLGIPLLAGRTFTDDEIETDLPVVIVNEAMTRAFWPGEDPQGQRMRLGGKGSSSPWLRVVGVVGDTRSRLQTEPPPAVYLPLSGASYHRFIVKTAVDPISIIGAIRDAIRSVDPGIPIAGIRPLEADISRTVATPRTLTITLGAFALFSTLLAVVGIFGLLAQAVSQRRGEIGIRLALGAETGRIMTGILARGLRLLLAGVAAGIAIALVFVRTVQPLLFETEGTDPVMFLAVSVLLIVTGIGVGIIPARRAMKVNPVEALRVE